MVKWLLKDNKLRMALTQKHIGKDFQNISTAFVNTRGNAIISSVIDISSTPIMSKALKL